MELHAFELEEVRKARREWADKLEALAIMPDVPAAQDADAHYLASLGYRTPGSN